MTRMLWVSSLAFCAALVAVPASAQKVAIVNIQRATLETSEVKKASTDLQAKYKTRTDALQKVQQELNDIQTQLSASQGKLSAQGEAELNTRGRRKQNEFDRLNEDLQ